MINISEQRLQTACLLFITAVLAAFGAYWLRPVLVPFVVAVFIVSGVSPILEALQRSVASTRLTAAVIAFLVGCLVVSVLMAALWASIVDLAENAGAYQSRVEELVEEAEDFFSIEKPKKLPKQKRKEKSIPPQKAMDKDTEEESGRDKNARDLKAEPASSENEKTVTEGVEGAIETGTVARQDKKVEADPPKEASENDVGEKSAEVENAKSRVAESSTPEPKSAATKGETETDDVGEVIDDVTDVTNFDEDSKLLTVPERMQEFVSKTLKSGVFKISQVLLEMFSASLIVLIYVFFLLLGAPTGASSSQVVQDVDKQIRSYLSLKTIISILTGLAFGTALWLFGIPMAVAFGMLAFLLNFIPNIGPVIASLLPLPLILLDPEGGVFWMASVISVTFGIQFVSGNVLEPKIMGQQSDLHPIVVLLALMFWGMLWGIVGMFLATPVTAAIRIGLSQFEQTKFVAELMAGRWPSEKQKEQEITAV